MPDGAIIYQIENKQNQENSGKKVKPNVSNQEKKDMKHIKINLINKTFKKMFEGWKGGGSKSSILMSGDQLTQGNVAKQNKKILNSIYLGLTSYKIENGDLVSNDVNLNAPIKLYQAIKDFQSG